MPIDPRKLQRAIMNGFDRVENFRKARYLFMREYTGAFYDSSDPAKATPLNLIFKAISILVPHLVSKNPKVTVGTPFAAYRPYAELLGLSLDDLSHSIGVKQTLRLCIADACVGVGVVKTGLAVTGQTVALPEELSADINEPYAERVDLDNLTFDPICRNLREAAFIGDRVRVPRQVAMDLCDNPDIIATLPGTDDAVRRGKDVATLSRKKKSQDNNELMDYVDLVETWVRADNTVVLTPYGERVEEDNYLRQIDYQGPDTGTGPYRFLGFHWIADNPMPIAPCGLWMDLHQMVNELAAKATRQAKRQKEVLIYGRAAQDDVQEILDTNDGESCAVDNPELVKTVKYGGGDDSLYKHLAWADAKFSESGPGDFQALGGETSGADTATQANILAQAGAIRIGDMKDMVYDFTAEITRDLAWMIHTDPLLEKPVVRQQPGGEQMTLLLTPEARRGDFLDFAFKIKPESMDRDNPQLRSQKLIQFQAVVTAAITAYQQFAMLGMPYYFNPVKYITMNAKAQGILDDIAECFNDQEFAAMMMQVQGMVPGMGSVGMPVQGPMMSQAAPRNNTVGLNPGASPNKSFAQVGSAGGQPGTGNPSGSKVNTRNAGAVAMGAV